MTNREIEKLRKKFIATRQDATKCEINYIKKLIEYHFHRAMNTFK